nr:hypothetical protein [uncultured Marinifilum sp.]
MNYKFSHIGIPTKEDKNWDGFYEPGKINFTDFNKDKFSIEWIKCNPDSPMHEMFQKIPHIAYQVDNIEEAIEGKEVIVETFSPGEGVRVAFINHNGAPIEFMEISK